MRRVHLTALAAAVALAAAGCSDDVKPAEPKLAPGTQPDPRLKPDSAGGTSTPRQAVKGD